MTTYFVSRHPVAVEWARRCGITVGRHVAHLDTPAITKDDTVLGTLPVNLAAEVCTRGARYLHLSVELPPQSRGRELSANELEIWVLASRRTSSILVDECHLYMQIEYSACNR